jgi:hypothetical protein|tara:strand:- start:349 stop:528 length:180 start_codon:yes stop_codon:yes gene_type:complete
MKHNDHKGLAEAVYYSKIKKEVEAKYLNRIDYLVNVNNELMKELELSEKRRYDILSGVE